MFPRQEKHFMKDPATANARIYVGNLDQKWNESHLETIFSPYGKILGISLQRTFGFIQFESETSAKMAINNEMGSIFGGKQLNVRGAKTGEGGKGNTNLKKLTQTQTPQSKPSGAPTPLATPTTASATATGPPTTTILNVENVGSVDNIDLTGGGSGGGADKEAANMYPRRVDRPSRMGVAASSFRDRSPLHPAHPAQLQGAQHRYQHRDAAFRDYEQRSSEFNVNMPAAVGSLNAPAAHNSRKHIDCNDCEIIVVAKSLTEYAEYIEHKLKQLGITVDLLFPNEDVPIGRVLANIASRGCLYAILITPQNEQYHSLTLNILYGLPEEHRNMPTEDAISLISKNFECYVQTSSGGGGNMVSSSLNGGGHNSIASKLLVKHSDTMQILLNLLAENRQLTVVQYDKVVKYLQERRELQYKYELETAANNNNNGGAGGAGTRSDGLNEAQASELQSRILNILNNTTSGGAASNKSSSSLSAAAAAASSKDSNNVVNDGGDDDATMMISTCTSSVLTDIVSSVISKISTTSSTTTKQALGGVTSSNNDGQTPAPLLNDPSVQKALDSLLQADLLKNIAINTTGSGSKMQPEPTDIITMTTNSSTSSNSASSITTTTTNNNNTSSSSSLYGINYSTNIRRF